ncbi:cell migration-inducing and hyaluronan-binding protein-like [Babylonia areolata]|uniref:cell migration-inducing and hyaluronan-binding protein-like n=1 Tax=Babylonia areolata TaxID=304850 RepID=UPI003FD37854
MEALRLLPALLATCLLQTPGLTASSPCPWRQPGLKPWDSAASWSSGQVPKNGTKVIIPRGTKILFNVAVNLRSLEIEPGAELIWADLPNLQLKTGHILVDGAFHMGSSSCRFTQEASIVLTGRSDSKDYISEDDAQTRKVILVRKGGTFEVHGRRKTSWTRLAQSLPLLSDVPCAVVYNHSDHATYPFAADRSVGLHVIVWNTDASVFDYGVYRQFETLQQFIANIPVGKIIGMTAYGKNGLGKREKAKDDFRILDSVIENQLGGKLYAETKPTEFDSYSLLTIKGSPSSTKEHFKHNGRRDVDFYQDFLYLHVDSTDLVFQVATSARTVGDYFRVLQASAALPVLELADNVRGWQPGDRIVVASTDYDWRQAEVREVIRCDHCGPSQVRVNATFRYRHYGNFTYNVDERAEVGLLTRNIVIEGEVEEECYSTNRWEKTLCDRFRRDTFGGHIKFLRDFKSVHVQGAELYHMGQQNGMGSYPLHFHMCDEARGAWLRDNSIHHTFSRCITVHGTDGLQVSGNVCYLHVGHGFFLEDSVEQNNVLSHNLGLGTMFGTLLMSDSSKTWCKKDYSASLAISCAEVSTFWITHPNNDVSNNAAAGSDCHGFMYVFADVPLGPSYDRQLVLGKVTPGHAKSYPIKRFYNNVAHSNERSGIFLDSYISAGGKGPRDLNVPLNGIVQSENEYEPRDPPGDVNGTRVWTKMERVTAYKNKQNNMWVKGGNLNVTFSSLADAATQSFSGGCTGFWTGVSLEYSVLIGRTDNVGQPRIWKEMARSGEELSMQFNGSIGKTPWNTITGVGIYQGPMFVKHSYFDRFATRYWNDAWKGKLGRRPVSYAGAISFKKDSTYPTYTSQYITNLTFGYCDDQNNGHYVFFGDPNTYNTYDWEDRCGPKNAFTYDKDGSVTGTPHTAIVRDRPFTRGRDCLPHKDWGMTVCPYRYVKVEFKGDDGSLSNELHDHYPLVARRDDNPQDIFVQKATQRMEYLMRTHSSFVVGLNTTLKGAAFPSEFRVFGYGVEKQDVVRVGLCVPKDLTNFTILSDYPVSINKWDFTPVYSLRALDADRTRNAIFHDIRNGILFFKVWSRHDRTNDSQLCPAGHCYKLRIVMHDGNRRAARDCMNIAVPPFRDTRPRPPKPTQKPCHVGSPQGLGAVRWEEVSKIVHQDFSVPCLQAPTPPPPSPTKKGCFVEDEQGGNFTLAQDHPRTMTVDWCIQRCHQRQYKYAGLTRSSICMCAQMLNTSDAATDVKKNKCVRRCKGSPKEKVKTCGNNGRLDVWSTGI